MLRVEGYTLVIEYLSTNLFVLIISFILCFFKKNKLLKFKKSKLFFIAKLFLSSNPDTLILIDLFK